jgi:hypothetical protein
MEYWQIEDLFGKRPHPQLSLHLEELDRVDAYYPKVGVAVRWFHLGLRNDGKGIAKFPGLRFRRDAGFELNESGIDGNGNFGLPLRSSIAEWIIFRGGVDDVIYPGETHLIGVISQAGRQVGIVDSVVGGRFMKTEWLFDATQFSCEISVDGLGTIAICHPVVQGTPISG